MVHIMTKNEVVEEGKIISEDETLFEVMLSEWGLPSENVIASCDERNNMMKLVPNLVESIPDEQKRDATYLSRFVASAAIGLFDASLNYIWNEVVVSLRKKIVYLGIDIFFDNAVSDKARDQYKNEEDLSGIKDRTMLETMRKLEWISNIVYLKLCHILDMRNQVGASHPNISDISSFELLAWAKVCVTDVINDQPSKSAVYIKDVIKNIKANDEVLDDVAIETIGNEITKLSTLMSSNLLRMLFDAFISDKTSDIARKNILKLSKPVWKICKDDVKYDLGEKKLFYLNNLQKDKEKLAEKFLKNCDGLSYLSITEKSLKISSLCDDLRIIHNGFDNFYREPSIAKEIMEYIKSADDIPKDRENKLIDTFLECRIGREVRSGDGVAHGAKDYYDALFKMLNEEQVLIALEKAKKYMESIYDGRSMRARNMNEIVEMLTHDDLNDRLKEMLIYMKKYGEKGLINKVYNEKGFKDLANGIIDV